MPVVTTDPNAKEFLDHVNRAWFNAVEEELKMIKGETDEEQKILTQLREYWQSLSQLTSKQVLTDGSINYLTRTDASRGKASIEQMTIKNSAENHTLTLYSSSSLDKDMADLLSNLTLLLLNTHPEFQSQNIRDKTMKFWKILYPKLNEKHKQLTGHDMIESSEPLSNPKPSSKTIEIDTQSILKNLYPNNESFFNAWPIDATKQVAKFQIPKTSIKLSLNGKGKDSLSRAHASIHAQFNDEEAAEAGKCCMLAYLDKFTHQKSKAEILSALEQLTIHSNNQAFIDSAQATLKQFLDQTQKPVKDEQDAIFSTPEDLKKIKSLVDNGASVKRHSRLPKSIPTGDSTPADSPDASPNLSPQASPGRQSMFPPKPKNEQPGPSVKTS